MMKKYCRSKTLTPQTIQQISRMDMLWNLPILCISLFKSENKWNMQSWLGIELLQNFKIYLEVRKIGFEYIRMVDGDLRFHGWDVIRIWVKY